MSEKQTLKFTGKYLADLLTEELCGDCSPLSDLRVDSIFQAEDGAFVLDMAPKEDDSK